MAAKAFGHSPRATASTARQAVSAAHSAAESDDAETNVSPVTPERLRASGGRRRLGWRALADRCSQRERSLSRYLRVCTARTAGRMVDSRYMTDSVRCSAARSR